MADRITVLEKFQGLVEDGGLDVVERIDVAPRQERRLPLAAHYLEGRLGAWVARTLPDGSAWRHQSIALERIDAGSNVVVATGTASGKSLIFQFAVMREMLEGTGCAIVVYPLKALLADQLQRWKVLAGELGLPEGTVQELHGDVPMERRSEALRTARVLVATPDLLQAWFMRQIGSPATREFLTRLRFLVIDEAHVYESVFGSNVAYLFRRLLVARQRVCRATGSDTRLQLIAATATIFGPRDHMQCLTGCDFDEIGDVDDGSPSHGRTLLHIAGPEGASAEGSLVDVIGRIHAEAGTGSFIAFHDSRQGVERVCSAVADDAVLPYRSGYETADRTRIERELRAGSLRGVVSTSALELGIDVAGFTVGMNLGVPQSKKAFRQRLGRVGRASPGVFAVMAPPQAFTRFGSSFAEYYAGSVEPSYLYLDNRFIQFAHARCLMDESEQLGSNGGSVPAGVDWPASFALVYEHSKPGARRPREFDYIAQLGADSPHLNYPLRQVGEANYKLKIGARDDVEQIGGIALNQAIREAYPGALYLHLKRPMKVREWRSSAFDRSIRLEDAVKAAPTRPILHTTVNVGAGIDDVVNSRIMSGAGGLLAEVALQVNESVLGFKAGGAARMYRDMRTSDPRMTKKQREFGTTGVVIRINEPWFSGGSGSPPIVRAAVGEALKQLLIREKSVAPNDIDYASTNIAFYEKGVPRRVTDTVVLYDSIYGGLRLTEPLFTDFDEFLERLERAADRAGAGAFVGEDVVSGLSAWYRSLAEGLADQDGGLVAPDGDLVVYASDSIVSVRVNGVYVERAILEPKLFEIGSTTMLMYRYDTGGEGEGWVPHDQIEPTGQDWRRVFWNPKTGVITDPEEDGEF